MISPPAPTFELQAFRRIAPFLAANGASPAITTNQAGKLVLLASEADGTLSVRTLAAALLGSCRHPRLGNNLSRRSVGSGQPRGP